MISTCTPWGGLVQVKGGLKSVPGIQSAFTSIAGAGNWISVPFFAALVCPGRTSYPLAETNPCASGFSRASSQMVAPFTTLDGGPPIALHASLGVSSSRAPSFFALRANVKGLPCKRFGGAASLTLAPVLPLAGYIFDCSIQFSQTT